MREYRRRRRDRLHLFRMEISKDVLDTLGRFNLLKAAERNDAVAVRTALYALCDAGHRALRGMSTSGSRDDATGAAAGLPDAVLDLPVAHGFLKLEQRRDQMAIIAAVERS